LKICSREKKKKEEREKREKSNATSHREKEGGLSCHHHNREKKKKKGGGIRKRGEGSTLILAGSEPGRKGRGIYQKKSAFLVGGRGGGALPITGGWGPKSR